MSFERKRSPIMSGDSLTKYEPIDPSSNWHDKKNQDSPSVVDIHKIEYIDGKKDNIVIPRKMEQIREPQEKSRNTINFTEEREKTIEREKTFRHWPHISPSRIQMFTAGWLLDETKSRCPYCGVEYENYQPGDNSLIIHRDRSPNCPFVLSSNPMHPSSVSIKSLGEVYPPKRIADEVLQPKSNVILTSHSSYAQKPEREKSFNIFPGGPPQNIEALVTSGFYCTGVDTLLQCYSCAKPVNHFDQYPPNEINTEHLRRFPDCTFARLISEKRETRSTHNADRCSWCMAEPKELAVDPCMDLAVCLNCAKLINTCPICGKEAKAFIRLYIS